MFESVLEFYEVCYLHFSGLDPPVPNVPLTELSPVVLLMVGILALRYTLRKYIFAPFGKSLNISEKATKQAPCNDVLEAAFKRFTKCHDISLLAKKTEMTDRQVERWWRLRVKQDKPSNLVKFTENMFKGTISMLNFFLGLYSLWHKKWFWDLDEYKYISSTDYSGGLWWYYMIGLSYYLALMVAQYWDVRRKDFWLMFVHHIVAVLLLSISWIGHLHRLGSIVLLLHDSTECQLELGKAAKLAGRETMSKVLFIIFIVFWIIGRLTLFPYWILMRMTVQSIVCNYILGYCLIIALWILHLLNLVWTWMIWHVLHRTFVLGKRLDDVRSSGSEAED